MITVERLEDDLLKVADKYVRRDVDGSWIGSCSIMFSTKEARAFRFFLEANERMKGKLIKATFKF